MMKWKRIEGVPTRLLSFVNCSYILWKKEKKYKKCWGIPI